MDGLDQRVQLVGEQRGLKIPRLFTKAGENAYDAVEWEKRTSLIKNPDGTIVFQMDNVEIPKFWSQTALDILAQKYFRKRGVSQFDTEGNPILDANGQQVLGSETSLKQVIHRLAGCWTGWGKKYNYFATEEDAQAFYDEISYTLLQQFAAPNSPQWFNTGLHWAYGITGPSQGHWFVDPDTKELKLSPDAYSHPQPHACADYFTVIYTEKGAKYIGEIVENNQIGLHILDGEDFVKILAVKHNGKKLVYRIKLSNGNYVDLTEDHLIFSSTKRKDDNGVYRWTEVKELKKDMRVQQIVGPAAVSDIMIDEKELAEARLVGWATGDGSVGVYDNVMRMEIITINDEEYTSVVNDIKTVFGEDVYFWVTKFQTDNQNIKGQRIHLSGKKLHSFVEKYQLMKRARTAEVPKEILYAPLEVIAEFLRALFQADGCVRIKKTSNSGDIVLSTVSEKLAFQVLQLLNILGIYARIYVEKEKRENRADLNQLAIAYGNSRRKFQQLVGFIDSTKSEKLALMNELVVHSKKVPVVREEMIEDIQQIGIRDVFDIQTESGKFLANGIVVHNCFIQPVRDDLVNEGGILDLAVREARIFKYGSGTGTNFSNLRAKGEHLSGGGTSSGVMSFLKIYDTVAGSIKSGGTTRRAAKMVLLNVDHPEIETFIKWKANEEKKFATLLGAGLVDGYNVESAGEHVFGQNSNNSVRVTDEFMKAVIEDNDWNLTWRTDGRVAKAVKARYLWDMIAQAAWECADPGLQFDTTYNDWHTSPASGRINATNPCSEFAYLDNSSCNLASLNLEKFLNGTFNVDAFKHAVRLWTIVLEISILMAQFPSKEIADVTYKTRSLGLGYTNLGSILMRLGIPYDSDRARAISAAISAIMGGESYATSAEMASILGSFEEFEKNKEHMLRVIRNHRRAVYNAPKEEYEKLSVVPPGINHTQCPEYLLKAAIESWDRALELGERYGYRNAQATLIAPTGTISFVMDADTTGVEPDFALVKFKKLVGGGYFKIVNKSVEPALRNLGYTEDQINDILRYLVGSNKLEGAPYINPFTLKRKGFTDDDISKMEKLLPSSLDLSFVFNVNTLGRDCLEKLGIRESQYTEPGFNLLKSLGFRDDEIDAAAEFICGVQTIEGAPHLKTDHYPIFDCANKCGKKGERYINYMAHVYMMAAVQPFLSGSISKTINMPNHATVDDIKKVYFESWKLALKSLALYRDGSKVIQPLSVFKQQKEETRGPVRRRMPAERNAIAHKFRVGNQEGYLHVGLFEDGTPGELFITVAKQGSTMRGLLDSFAQAISIGIQYGVPLKVWISKHINNRFEPMGWTDNPDIPVAKSIMDYIFRWMAFRFLPKDDLNELGLLNGGKTLVNGETEEVESQSREVAKLSQFVEKEKEDYKYDLSGDAPACYECGGMMVRSGSCYVCTSCGATSGCS